MDGMRMGTARGIGAMMAVLSVITCTVAPTGVAAAATNDTCTVREYKPWNDDPSISTNRVSSDCTLHIGPGKLQYRSDYLSDGSLGGEWRKIRKVVIDDPANTRLQPRSENAFNYPKAESVTGIDLIGTSDATSMDGIIQLPSLTSDIDISRWDTSHVTSMKSAFANTDIGKVKGIEGLDTSRVTTFEYAFYGTNLPSPRLNLRWRTSAAVNMKSMFKDAAGVMPDIRGFDVSHVTNFDEMFYQTGNRRTRPTGIDVTGWRINTTQPVSMKSMFAGLNDGLTGVDGLDTSHVTDMSFIFDKTKPARTIDLSHWVTSNVTSFYSMFARTDLDRFSGFEGFDTGHGTNFGFMFFDIERSAATLRDLSHWNMSSAQNLESMFRMHDQKQRYMEGSPGIYGIKGMDQWNITSNVTTLLYLFQTETTGGYRPSMNLSRWDVSGVKNMSYAFTGMDMSGISGIAGWDVSHVDGMEGTFKDTKGTMDFTGWGMVGAPQSTGYMFAGAQIDGFTGIDRLRTQDVISMRGMFSNAVRSASNPIDLSGWDIKNVTDVSSMFQGEDMEAFPGVSDWRCDKLQQTSNMFNNAKTEHDIDLSWMAADKLVWVNGMFDGMHGFDHVKGIESFDMSSARGVAYMFRGTDGSLPLDLSQWNTSHVSDFSELFKGMTRHVSGYSRWDTGSANSMRGMFNGYLGGRIDGDLSQWNTSRVTDMAEMFKEADINGIDIKSWNVSNVYSLSGMFMNAKTSLLDVSGWVMRSYSINSGMFMSRYIDAYRFGTGMRMNDPFKFNMANAWYGGNYTGRWSMVPSDRDDASTYWLSTKTYLKADDELTARLNEGKPENAGTYVRERDMILRYDANTHDGNPVSGIPPTATITWPTSPTSDRVATGPTPSTRDWSFTGWNTKADGSGTAFMPGDVVPIANKIAGDNYPTQIMYAQWERIIRKVKYDDGSGEASGVPAVADVNSGDGYTVTDSIPSRPGYSLAGWSDDGTDTVKYRPGDRIGSVTEDVTLHAVWRADPSRLPDAGNTIPWMALVIALIVAILTVAAVSGVRKAAGGRGRHARR